MTVTDPKDASIDCDRVTVSFALGHDDHDHGHGHGHGHGEGSQTG